MKVDDPLSIGQLPSRLVSTRERLGLSQSRVAVLLGTSQPNVSRYEDGTLVPGSVVGGRLQALVNLDDGSLFSVNPVGTIPAYAVQIRRALLAGSDRDVMTRLIVQLSDDFRSLSSGPDRKLFLSEPSSTGDRRYDALLAGLAVHLCREAEVESTPPWTRNLDRYLQQLWWYGPAGDIPALRAIAFRDTPSSLRVRGVVFSGRNLDSV